MELLLNNPGGGHLPIRTAFLERGRRRQRRLYVISPYLADHDVLRAILAAARRGVDVRSSCPTSPLAGREGGRPALVPGAARRGDRPARASRAGPRQGRPVGRPRPRRDVEPGRAQPPPELGAAGPDREQYVLVRSRPEEESIAFLEQGRGRRRPAPGWPRRPAGSSGDCARKTWISRIACRSSSEPGHAGRGQLPAQRRVGDRLAGAAWARTCERPKKSLSIDAVSGYVAPEVEQVGDRLQRLAALAEHLADPGVFEVAGLGHAAPDEVGPLVLVDVAIGPADDQQLVERDDQLGGLLLDDLEVLDDLAGL